MCPVALCQWGLGYVAERWGDKAKWLCLFPGSCCSFCEEGLEGCGGPLSLTQPQPGCSDLHFPGGASFAGKHRPRLWWKTNHGGGVYTDEAVSY